MQVHGFLYKSKWETRIAAGDTIGQLAAVFAHHDTHSLREVHDQGSLVKMENDGHKANTVACSSNFRGFNLQHLIEGGTALVASGGQV